jgi:hypothetical protein
MAGIEYGQSEAEKQGQTGTPQPGAMLSGPNGPLAFMGSTPGIGPNSPQALAGAAGAVAPGFVPPTIQGAGGPQFGSSAVRKEQASVRAPGLTFAALAQPGAPRSNKPLAPKEPSVNLTKPEYPLGGGA